MARAGGCAYPLRRMNPPTRARAGACGRAARLAVALLATAASPALAQPPVLSHAPPATARAGEPLYLSLTVLGAAPRDGVLAWRSGPGPFAESPLRIDGAVVSAVLRGEQIRPPLLEYYFRVILAGDSVATFPSADPLSRPVAVAVGAGPARVVPLSPAPGETLRVERPEIVALIDPPLEPGEELLLLLDGREVTGAARIEPGHFSLVPDEALEAGEHEARAFVLGGDPATAGAALERRWRFFLLPAAPPSRGPIRDLHGRLELGWALVAAGVSDSTALYLPYPRASEPQLDLQLRGRAGGEHLSLLVDRDAVYDRRTRWTARARRGGREVEAGYVFPFVSEDILAWLAADGLVATAGAAGRDSRLVLIRTESAATGGGFASYDRYLAAGSHEARFAGGTTLLVAGSHGFDDRGSLPAGASETGPDGSLPYVSSPVRNSVGALELRRTRGRATLASSLAWSRMKEGDAEREAWGGRLGWSWQPSSARFELEYRDHRPGYFALGNPTLNSGERGFFLQASLGGRRRLRGNVHLELYRDHESDVPQEKEPIRQLWARMDVDASRIAPGTSAYLLLRHFRVPYVGAPYRSEYAALGLHRIAGLVGWALSASATRTRETASSLVWTGNLDLWYRPARGAGELKTSFRWDRGTDDLGDVDYHRGTIRQEFAIRSHGYEARLSGEWLRRLDRLDPVQSYRELLLALSCGRTF